MRKKKNIFIAATGQNVGKTTTSVGLFSKLRKNDINAGFIKPVGQRYVEIGDLKVDEDSHLLHNVYNMDHDIKDMNPIAVPRGFTEEYIVNPKPDALMKEIKDAYKRIEDKTDFVVIEGTGHAGVGSVFDTNNAVVAKALGSKVVMVTNAGIGNAIDQVILNKQLFDAHGIETLGVIINKVLETKYEKIKSIIKKGLENQGIKLLGVVPYKNIMESPSMSQLRHLLNGTFIAGEENKDLVAEHVIVGAMTLSNVLNVIEKNTLIITPGDRDDIILGAMSHIRTYQDKKRSNVAGMIITGGINPSSPVRKIIKNNNIPVISCKMDTFTCASLVHDLNVKIQPTDEAKINICCDLFDDYVDFEYIIDNA